MIFCYYWLSRRRGCNHLLIKIDLLSLYTIQQHSQSSLSFSARRALDLIVLIKGITRHRTTARMAGFDDVKDSTYGGASVVASRHVYNEEVRFVDEHERNDLARGLKQRHVQMIAIAGAIVCHSHWISSIFPRSNNLYASRVQVSFLGWVIPSQRGGLWGRFWATCLSVLSSARFSLPWEKSPLSFLLRDHLFAILRFSWTQLCLSL